MAKKKPAETSKPTAIEMPARPGNSVPLRQPGDALPACAFCEWMPFQVGQARAQSAESPK